MRHDHSGWPVAAVAATVAALEPLADPQRAVPMAAYMRDQYRFLGIGTPARTAALKIAWRALPTPSGADAAAAAAALWALPEREFQYAGCDLLARWHPTLTPDLLRTAIQPLITTKSWWDTVDSLRKAAVGPLVAAHPQLVATLRRWIEDDDRWLVRSALIHQLGYGPNTDADLLFEFCARRASDPQFFVAKAIGWALRSYSRQAPDAVREFVTAHPQLSPLARREALKHL